MTAQETAPISRATITTGAVESATTDSPVIRREDPLGSIRAMAAAHNNWGRWGADDVLGTLNFIDAAKRIEAAALVKTGEAFSLSQPFDTNGPQKGWRRRTNPVHTMTDTGVDAERGNQGFPHGFGGADDVDCHAVAVLHAVGRPGPHFRPRQGLEWPCCRGRGHL